MEEAKLVSGSRACLLYDLRNYLSQSRMFFLDPAPCHALLISQELSFIPMVCLVKVSLGLFLFYRLRN